MRVSHRFACLALISFPICLMLGAAFTRVSAQTGTPGTHPAAKKPTDTKPQYKGIFEPVNYAEDVEFSDVWFVDGDTGWAVGAAKPSGNEEGGFIIKTTDGGKTWSLQMGDPHSATRGMGRLFFLDSKHGWASQSGSKLLRTTDGENWEVAGDFHTGNTFVFVTPQKGFTLDGTIIKMTTDGGASWKPQYECKAKVDVNGLPHEDACHLQAIAFATPTVGYAVSSEVSDKSSVVVKTTDGGNTWSVASFIPNATGLDNSFGFKDESTGFVKTYQGKLMATFDGAGTWHGIPSEVPGGRPRIQFAGPTGWSMEGKAWIYSTDGGKHWVSRDIPFPTDVVTFSLGRSDRGYVVGSHGMVYRYRVVPVDYKVAHGIDAPVMPGNEDKNTHP